MTKIIVFLSIAFGFSFFHETPDSLEKESKHENIEIVVSETIQPKETILAKPSAYESYLQELNVTGPKEGSDEQVSINPNTRKKIIDKGEAIVADDENVETTIKKPTKEVSEILVNMKETETTIVAVDHKAFGELLKKHVDSKGNVNYVGFKADKAKLEAYINTLTSNPLNKDMGKNERLSYWINLYNALTIKLIVDNYPVKSITDLEGGKPWDKLLVVIGSTSYSLNNIENNIIRKRFTEPRIHFAVNCAAKSCPPILNDAFYPNTLTNQLAARAKSFLEDSNYNTVSSSKLEVSKIFDWYGKDFGDVKSYIQQFTNQDLSNATLTFKEYDWSLNKK